MTKTIAAESKPYPPASKGWILVIALTVAYVFSYADRKIIATLAPRLKADGLYFVGLDVIGGKLTEVNVTSPTGIQQMSRLDGENYSGRVLDWTAKRVGG